MRERDYVKSITVQPGDCEDFMLVPVRFLTSLREEIDGLRQQLGLPARQWEPRALLGPDAPTGDV